ncbi:L,D-transpeptidase family protein [Croceicoccus mobilis]|uniref:L,D-transpeptidase family protein n=1 Tax=Croceicoccus mobilis TaxID=1703339 RepID=UPI001E362702|nr:L,D-transpeptidase family protein [Croceicoccus mobilis]
MLLAAMLMGFAAAPVIAQGGSPPERAKWSPAEIAVLARWVEAAPLDALPSPSMRALDAARASDEAQAIDAAADALALELARGHLLGAATKAERAGWNITDSDADIDLPARIDRALAAGKLDRFFAGLAPAYPDYAVLKQALARETDAENRTTIARNMERWRWMPQRLGRDFIIVNAAAFKLALWRDGSHVGDWRVINGKTSTPTPVFQAEVTGVNLNPWWYVPASIVRESVGSLIRKSPQTAKARGYVWDASGVRQRPGPTNALGQMKLVMPNRFSVYLHDTPNKTLFEKEVRAFSHGCVRVGDALGFAATLLDTQMTREEVDAVVATNKSTVVDLNRPLAIYITYFTAMADDDGGVKIMPDIYRRDGRIRSVAMAPAPVKPVRLAAAGGCF